MYRKRKVSTPGFGHTPYNPLHGDQANLRHDGTAPYCAMMQIAAKDIYENHVICRGYDPRTLRFIDYAAGNPNKPGISVAKPFGNRVTNWYAIAEVYPALLPTQGNSGFSDFRQVIYTPPSPTTVQWRVGQNPGFVNIGHQEGGQPKKLTDKIEVLYDHNGKVINWMLMDNQSNRTIQFEIQSLSSMISGPYTGLKKAEVTVHCGPGGLIGETVDVIDHSGCNFDEDSMDGYTGWAFWGQAWSLDTGEPCETLTPPHWIVFTRCCDPDTGTYREPC